jgi:predicted O-linked N-acetylglucosamine transferase (SPINDLY family)
LRAARDAYLSGLQELSRDGLQIDNPFSALNITNFYLAYQGMNERDSQALLGRTLAAASPMLRYASPALDRARKPGALRVGFISRYLGRHSVGMCYNNLIAALAADADLDVTVALLGASRAQEAKELIGEDARIVVLPGDLQGIRTALSQLSLDVLIFTDIGMEPSTYLLAFGRYAPLQGVLAGHPITTGIPSVDFFVSSRANEAADADGHYTERLVRFEGLPVAITAPPQLPPASVEAMGLPQNRHLYLCPLKLQKMHPDFDAALAGMLDADPAALIIMIDDDARSRWGMLVRERLARSLGGRLERVRFMPWMPFADLLRLMSASDVVIDTFHFGAGTTAYYALMAGTPVVTLPSAYLRGRHTLGYLARIGLTQCVARDAADYVRIAAQVAGDRDLQRDLRSTIRARRAELADYRGVVREFADFLLAGRQ